MVLKYKHFNRSKKKETVNSESSASNTVIIEDWTNEVHSLFTRKIEVSCANNTLILIIKFIRSEDNE